MSNEHTANVSTSDHKHSVISTPLISDYFNQKGKEYIRERLEKFVKQSNLNYQYLFNFFHSSTLRTLRHRELAGESLVATDALRVMQLVDMRISHAYTAEQTHAYFFNYSYHEGEDVTDEMIAPTQETLSTIVAYQHSLKSDGVIRTDMIYSRNPKPELILTAAGVSVHTPIGIRGVIDFTDLHNYPEICKEVSLFCANFFTTNSNDQFKPKV